MTVIDGRFELLERLGGGGMGLVWRARDTMLHRDVALKEVRPPEPVPADGDPEDVRRLRERVLREARALARAQHPNVVTIHHIVDRPELPHPWLVMELVDGGSLQDRLERGPLSPAEAALLGGGVLAGLRAAHAEGVMHRDVKPANVMLRRDGTPVLTDFGIATLRDATRLTATGGLIGSPEFIAPERIRGEEGNPASDLWSLGMLLYVAVEGRHPWRRENSLATLVAVLDEPLPPPLRSGPLQPVLGALLVRDPADRPDGDRLAWMLAQAARDPGTVPPAADRPQAPDAAPAASMQTRPDLPRPVRQRGRRMWVALPAAVTALLLWAVPTQLVPLIRSGADSITIGAGGTTAGAGGTTAAASDDLLTPAGVRAAIKALKPVMGGTKVVSLTVYPEYAIAEAPAKSDKLGTDTFQYRDGKAEQTTITGDRDADDPLIDLSKVKWDVLPALLKQAQKKLNVPKPTMRYVIVQSGSIDNVSSLYVYRVDKYGGGYLQANLQGRTTLVMPKGG